ncbi:cytochrome P450 [Pseudonocardia sp. DSM 110487]|uniref:cytochrome P450 family protein n=1 Tax=Pseudonocardia sp. DSM 110487 TaxID=2865833 RepID=UPI001C698A17|nr:cytochrome P450 [Pseudonocardia sp. DSM 110487]QYN34197.1 cytochrome P450 [Pseudonocardia sp. DSM 110487]
MHATFDPYTATADGARHAAYAALAARGPVHQVRLPSGVKGWLVTSHDAARVALTHPGLSKGGPSRAPYADELPPVIAAAINHHMLAMDPPDHTRLRKLVSAAFTRRRTEALAPGIQQLADDLLDGLADRDEADLITAFAYPLPIAVICRLLGVPDTDHHLFREWTAPLVVGGNMAGIEAYSAAATALVAYVRELLAEKRRRPTDDLLSALVAARDGEDRLTEDELTSMVYLLLLAGHETTVNLIGNGVLALLTHPDQLALLRAEPERLPAAVEELLRFDGPLQSAIPAIATEPVEIAGTTIPEGANVVVALLAANRDPDRLPRPDRLDLTRTQSLGHLAFGHGVHHCLGAPLARLEGRIAIGGLVTRFPRLRLAVPAAEITRTPGLMMNGLAELPVRLR